MHLEPLERRELFSVSSPLDVNPVPALAAPAIVAQPAALGGSLAGTYNGPVQITTNKETNESVATVKIDANGTVSGTLIISKKVVLKLKTVCTFEKSGKHFWVAQRANFTCDITVQLSDSGTVVIDVNLSPPGLPDTEFHFTGHRVNSSASPSLIAAKTTPAQPLAAAASPLIGLYSGEMATAGIPHRSYVVRSSVTQSSGSNLKLVNTVTLPRFGALVETFVVTPNASNQFSLSLGKSSTGQAQTLSGRLDKHSNLLLTYFAPPKAALTGTLTRI